MGYGWLVFGRESCWESRAGAGERLVSFYIISDDLFKDFRLNSPFPQERPQSKGHGFISSWVLYFFSRKFNRWGCSTYLLLMIWLNAFTYDSNTEQHIPNRFTGALRVHERFMWQLLLWTFISLPPLYSLCVRQSFFSSERLLQKGMLHRKDNNAYESVSLLYVRKLTCGSFFVLTIMFRTWYEIIKMCADFYIEEDIASTCPSHARISVLHLGR
jgi:hypothetical protein